MSDSQPRLSPAAARLLEATIARLWPLRRTFTEEEALRPLWEEGYEIAAHPEVGFALAREADGRHERQWRLAEQRLANDRLLDLLVAGAWDGRDLDAQLARLDTEEGGHHTFCSIDDRFETERGGMLVPARREVDAPLLPAVQAELEALGPALLGRWREAGAAPMTVRGLTAWLGDLGWPGARERESWLLVRSWLRGWSLVQRVGQDYWLPAVNLPTPPARARLSVLPVHPADRETPAQPATVADADRHVPPPEARGAGKQVQLDGVAGASSAAWTTLLRTINLIEGFLSVPVAARAAYPVRATGEGDHTALPGLWHTTGDGIWLWLDRAGDRLFGPPLAEHLAWCEAGDLLRVDWAPDAIVLRVVGHDDEIQREEARLVDLEELAALRGGLGESYRQSLQAILLAAPDGLPFADVVAVLRERQGHAIHRGTIRAVLASGGFVHRQGRWFAAANDAAGGRQLRAVLVDAMVANDDQTTASNAPGSEPERLRARAQAIRTRLLEMMRELTASPAAHDRPRDQRR